MIRSFARRRVLFWFVATILLLGGFTADSMAAPTVRDWGIYNNSGGLFNKESDCISLESSGKISQDSEGLTLYVQFSNNVTVEDYRGIWSNNRKLFSIQCSDGQPVGYEVWSKSNQEDPNARQFVFITLSKNLNPNKKYWINIAPGVQANNNQINTDGGTIGFTYAGTNGEEEQRGQNNTDDNSQQADGEKNQTDTDKEEEKKEETKQETGGTTPGSGNTQKETGTSSKDFTSSGGTNGSTGSGNKSTNSGGSNENNSNESSPSNASGAGEAGRQRTATVSGSAEARAQTPDPEEGSSNVQKLSEAVTATLNGAGQQTVTPDDDELEALTTSRPGSIYVLIAGLIFLGIIGAGAATETISFHLRLNQRSKAA